MIEQLRTHNCGALRKNDIDKQVTLSGWINDIRVKKFAIFLDLRDMYGLTQIIIRAEHEQFANLSKLKVESVVQVTGAVVVRKAINPKIPTGEIEIIASEVNILSAAADIPFVLKDETVNASEELRLKYRYLDLRRPEMNAKLQFKHKTINIIRNFLNEHDFLEIETPCLTKSTPEGARDFLVPSRIKKNSFYALPQSPQLYKQLLMVSGIDKYYQIAKCFRDEDFRADRQPEFQQLDLEMAFANQSDVMNFIEKMIVNLWEKLNLPKLTAPFARLPYHDAINLYGSDKPDLRCTCQIVTIKSDPKHSLKGLWVNDKIDDATIKALLRILNQHQVKNLIIYSLEKEKIIFNNTQTILSVEELALIKKTNPQSQAKICLLTAGDHDIASVALGAIRTFYCLDQAKQAKHSDFLANINTYNLLWVVDWPMFEQVAGKLAAAHHPFTSPLHPQDFLNAKPADVLTATAAAYDLVLNGNEIGGGSVRIFDKTLQYKIFDLLGLSKTTIANQFGFFLEAFNYGIPPHAGIAFGLDRLIMILTNSHSIRDSIAFPKNNSGVDLLTNAPSSVDITQLEILGLKIMHDK